MKRLIQTICLLVLVLVLAVTILYRMELPLLSTVLPGFLPAATEAPTP